MKEFIRGVTSVKGISQHFILRLIEGAQSNESLYYSLMLLPTSRSDIGEYIIDDHKEAKSRVGKLEELNKKYDNEAETSQSVEEIQSRKQI
ncbi:hypothetical protein P8452_46767 [Trifolium repens]|nr:hypothetical protein P8452_46767 [Trifolium repens]